MKKLNRSSKLDKNSALSLVSSMSLPGMTNIGDLFDEYVGQIFEQLNSLASKLGLKLETYADKDKICSWRLIKEYGGDGMRDLYILFIITATDSIFVDVQNNGAYDHTAEIEVLKDFVEITNMLQDIAKKNENIAKEIISLKDVMKSKKVSSDSLEELGDVLVDYFSTIFTRDLKKGKPLNVRRMPGSDIYPIRIEKIKPINIETSDGVWNINDLFAAWIRGENVSTEDDFEIPFDIASIYPDSNKNDRRNMKRASFFLSQLTRKFYKVLI